MKQTEQILEKMQSEHEYLKNTQLSLFENLNIEYTLTFNVQTIFYFFNFVNFYHVILVGYTT